MNLTFFQPASALPFFSSPFLRLWTNETILTELLFAWLIFLCQRHRCSISWTMLENCLWNVAWMKGRSSMTMPKCISANSNCVYCVYAVQVWGWATEEKRIIPITSKWQVSNNHMDLCTAFTLQYESQSNGWKDTIQRTHWNGLRDIEAEWEKKIRSEK